MVCCERFLLVPVVVAVVRPPPVWRRGQQIRPGGQAWTFARRPALLPVQRQRCRSSGTIAGPAVASRGWRDGDDLVDPLAEGTHVEGFLHDAQIELSLLRAKS